MWPTTTSQKTLTTLSVLAVRAAAPAPHLKSLVSFDFRDHDGLQFEVVVRGQGDAIHLLFVLQLELPDRHLVDFGSGVLNRKSHGAICNGSRKGATTKQTVLGTKHNNEIASQRVDHKCKTQDLQNRSLTKICKHAKKRSAKLFAATHKCSNIPKNCSPSAEPSHEVLGVRKQQQLTLKLQWLWSHYHAERQVIQKEPTHVV